MQCYTYPRVKGRKNNEVMKMRNDDFQKKRRLSEETTSLRRNGEKWTFQPVNNSE